jgi:virginiamycin B lyase
MGAGLAGAARGQPVTEFTIPTARSQPLGIAAGPDGALWFTEGIGKIGRITTAGVATEFPVPTVASQPGEIAAGPDGALWFTELAASKIGRITTAGAITEFDPHGDESFPLASRPARTATSGLPISLSRDPTSSSSTARSGGSPQSASSPSSDPRAGSRPFESPPARTTSEFTESGTGKIGRITLAGVLTEFLIPTACSPARHGGRVGRQPLVHRGIFPNGDLSVAKIRRIHKPASSRVPPSAAGNDRWCGGPDGNLWFTEDFVSKIGRSPTAEA